MDIFEKLAQDLKGQGRRIVFPEGSDKRIMGAAVRLKADGVVDPVLLGNQAELKQVASENNFDLSGIEILDPATYPAADKQAMHDALLERRKGKNTPEEVDQMLTDVSYFGTMLVYLGKVDGMVSGAVHSTGATVRPALQIIKTKPGQKRISGAFIMQKGEERYIFADCAINIELDAETMAAVALQSAETAELFGLDPKVAMLSFSTKGSAKGERGTKVAEATKLVQAQAPTLAVDGNCNLMRPLFRSGGPQGAWFQGCRSRQRLCLPKSGSGNIGYKIAQRFGGLKPWAQFCKG